MTPSELANWHCLLASNFNVGSPWTGARDHHLKAALSIIKWRGKPKQRAEANRLLAILTDKMG